MFFGIDQMRTYMIFDDFGHQARHGAARTGNQVHDLFTARLACQCSFDALDLAPEAAHASQQLLLFANGMAHLSSLA